MKKTFVMRGQTASGLTEVLEFGGKQKETKGMAYRMTEFTLFPSTNTLSQSVEMCASITAGKTALDPENPDYNNEGLIGTALSKNDQSQATAGYVLSIVNDTFLITQNLKLLVKDTYSNPVNWQCKFKPVKLTDAGQANVNYRQFSVFDD